MCVDCCVVFCREGQVEIYTPCRCIQERGPIPSLLRCQRRIITEQPADIEISVQDSASVILRQTFSGPEAQPVLFALRGRKPVYNGSFEMLERKSATCKNLAHSPGKCWHSRWCESCTQGLPHQSPQLSSTVELWGLGNATCQPLLQPKNVLSAANYAPTDICVFVNFLP